MVDIHLREGMRIVCDWIEFEHYVDRAPDSRQVALSTLGEVLRSGHLWQEALLPLSAKGEELN
jgi:hypothetical protein